jgi:hypothetical protein
MQFIFISNNVWVTIKHLTVIVFHKKCQQNYSQARIWEWPEWGGETYWQSGLELFVIG